MSLQPGGDDRQSSAAAFLPAALDPAEDLQGFRRRPDDEGLALDHFTSSEPHDSSSDEPYVDRTSARETTAESESLTAPTESACPVTPRAIVEAILFVGHATSEGLTSRFLAALMRGVRPAEIDAMVQELNEEYTRLGCPYTIATGTSGYRLVLREEHLNLRESFQGKIRQAKLSQPAIDTLAVVAYRQPIGRQSIVDFCDTATPAVLSQLVRRGLLSMERTAPGANGWQYSTTDRFLAMFGLETLADLPRPQGDEDRIE